MTETHFDWRYAIVVGFVSALVAVAIMVSVLVVLANSAGMRATGDDNTVVGLVVAALITPLLSGLLAFSLTEFTAKAAAMRQALAAIFLSLLFDVALGVPAAVLAVVLTRPL